MPLIFSEWHENGDDGTSFRFDSIYNWASGATYRGSGPEPSSSLNRCPLFPATNCITHYDDLRSQRPPVSHEK